jgi:hypothetical protein
LGLSVKPLDGYPAVFDLTPHQMKSSAEKKAHGRQDAVGSGTPARLFVNALERGHNAFRAFGRQPDGQSLLSGFSHRHPQKLRMHCVLSKGANSLPPQYRFKFTATQKKMQV